MAFRRIGASVFMHPENDMGPPLSSAKLDARECAKPTVDRDHDAVHET